MNASIRSVPIHPRLAARPALGMPTAVVMVSALVVANVSVLAGSSAWPTVRATHASAAAPSTKARVIKINRRLKGDHLALPGASQQVLHRQNRPAFWPDNASLRSPHTGRPRRCRVDRIRLRRMATVSGGTQSTPDRNRGNRRQRRVTGSQQELSQRRFDLSGLLPV
jgi:hypothetical protein